MNSPETPLTKASRRIKDAVDSGRIHPHPSDGTVSGARGNLLLPRRDRSGFLMVSFGGDYAYIHRIIAYVAFGEIALQPGMQVIHLNGKKIDNRAVNLKVISLLERGRTAAARKPAGMDWKVVDPASGKAIAHFRTRQLAEEYARFKFDSTAPCQPRTRVPQEVTPDA